MKTIVTLIATVLITSAGFAAQPLRLHPNNPRWFEWRGKATALITSGEHYGAALNPDFDFHRYLETLQRDGLNYTRLFSGSYVEPSGAFGITRNTLAPASGRFLAPWARSNQSGYAGGGNKFDLDRYSPDYLARLKEFIAEAGKRGIVVELTLFCSTYTDAQWAVHPFNPTNNIQALPVDNWKHLHTAVNGLEVMAVQEKFARWLVRELNGFDNLFFEIQNEPWSDNHTMGDYINPYWVEKHSFPNAVEITSADSVKWQRTIAHFIVDEEGRLPNRHLCGGFNRACITVTGSHYPNLVYMRACSTLILSIGFLSFLGDQACSAQTNLVAFPWDWSKAHESVVDLTRFLNASAGKDGFVRVQDGIFSNSRNHAR